jgi:hypothetical protein
MLPSEGLKLPVLWGSLCGAGEEALRGAGDEAVCLGGATWRLPRTRFVSSPDELLSAPRTVIGWCAAEAAPIGRIRRALLPGGIVAILTTPPSGALRKLWPWHAPEPDDAALTTALVLHGFLEPTRVRCADGAVVVHARVPARPGPLDAVFEA